jgi:antirestriction protein ArdC
MAASVVSQSVPLSEISPVSSPSVYEIVTEQIIKQLESGVSPWRKPWRTLPPANLISKKPYRGINVFLLAFAGFGSQFWLTYRQAQQGRVQTFAAEKSAQAASRRSSRFGL